MQTRQSTTRSSKMNARQTIGILVFVCTSVLPALLLTNFLPDFGALTFGLTTWLAVALIGGALAGSMMMTNMRYWYVGMVSGVLSGPGVLLATYYYTLYRTHLFSIEIIIPIVIGALPGLFFLSIVSAIFGKKMRGQKALSAGQNMPIMPYQQPQYPQMPPANDPRYQQ